MKTVHKLAIGAVALAGTISLGAGVYAAQTPIGIQNRMSGLVSAIATKFNLNSTEVQQVFDDQHALNQQQMQGQRQDQMKTRLDQAVTSGQLTQAQEDLIIAKHKEVQDFMASLKDKTPDERQAAIKTETDALKQWATDNNIPQQYFAFGLGRGEMMGMGTMKAGMRNMHGAFQKAAK
ncbi:MAG: hypothetical protein WCT54_03010 [Patescibacteria group bacterium]|jgi:hypothetical protein